MLETSASIAPEICIEIISSSNSFEEMETKKKLYFEVQAQEFWLCDQEGNIKFYSPQGKLQESKLIPQFPNKIQRRII